MFAIAAAVVAAVAVMVRNAPAVRNAAAVAISNTKRLSHRQSFFMERVKIFCLYIA